MSNLKSKKSIKIDPSKVIRKEPMRWKEGGGGGFEFVALLLIVILIIHAFSSIS